MLCAQVTAAPEMGHFKCSGGDFIVLMCDGICEGDFTNAEVCKLVGQVLAATGRDAAKAAEAVCKRAIETESKDNISCMIVLLGGVEASNPRARAPPPIMMGTQREFIAGPLTGIQDGGFVKAYVAMCSRGGVSFAEAAESRHALLSGRRGTAGAMEDDEAELALIGKPAGAPGSVQRRSWFEGWARQCQATQEDSAPVQGGGPAAKLAMMKMLMGMVQAEQMANPTPADSEGGARGGRRPRPQAQAQPADRRPQAQPGRGGQPAQVNAAASVAASGRGANAASCNTSGQGANAAASGRGAAVAGFGRALGGASSSGGARASAENRGGGGGGGGGGGTDRARARIRLLR